MCVLVTQGQGIGQVRNSVIKHCEVSISLLSFLTCQIILITMSATQFTLVNTTWHPTVIEHVWFEVFAATVLIKIFSGNQSRQLVRGISIWLLKYISNASYKTSNMNLLYPVPWMNIQPINCVSLANCMKHTYLLPIYLVYCVEKFPYFMWTLSTHITKLKERKQFCYSTTCLLLAIFLHTWQ
jgi:hypothetical protein